MVTFSLLILTERFCEADDLAWHPRKLMQLHNYVLIHLHCFMTLYLRGHAHVYMHVTYAYMYMHTHTRMHKHTICIQVIHITIGEC